MRRTPRFLLLVLGIGFLASSSHAQDFMQRGRFRGPRVAFATPENFDGSFQFCRLAYQGRSWATDYPGADHNISIRLSELTKTAVSMNSEGDPNTVIVRPTDETLFQCPFTMLWQADSLWVSDEDAVALRAYLQKGGFIWADDFWGTRAWNNFEAQIAKVLPPAQYQFVDIPPSHAMLHTLFDVERVPQVPSISFWRGSRGHTSENGRDSAEVHVRGIFDDHGRLMVLATHNTDIADGWEREGEDPAYFYTFSVNSYAVAINTVLFAMTH